MNEEEEDKALYVFEHMISNIVPNDGTCIELNLNGEVKTLFKKGSLYFLEDWGWTTTYGLFKYFQELKEK